MGSVNCPAECGVLPFLPCQTANFLNDWGVAHPHTPLSFVPEHALVRPWSGADLEVIWLRLNSVICNLAHFLPMIRDLYAAVDYVRVLL